MNAVATKPRASKKAQSQQADFTKHLNGARALWREADALLTEVWDKSEPGEPLELMLGHIIEHLMPEDVRAPLMKETPTSADIERIHQALFTPIACLVGAASVASGTILDAPLQRVHSILDELQNRCDSAMPLASLAPSEPPQDDPAAFMKGKALACAMFSQVHKFKDGGAASINTYYRSEAPGSYVAQECFVQPYLERLATEPALMEGFSAALSDLLVQTVERGSFEEHMAWVPYEEARGPVRGDIEVWESDRKRAPDLIAQIEQYGFAALASQVNERQEPHRKPTGAARVVQPVEPGLLMVQEPDVPSPDVPQAKNALETDGKACATTRAWFRAMEANAILRGQLEQLDDVALYGAAVLTQIAEDHFSNIVPGPNQPELSSDALEIGVRHLNEARAVVEVVYDNGLDDPCLSGVIALLSMGKDSANEAIGQVMARERAK